MAQIFWAKPCIFESQFRSGSDPHVYKYCTRSITTFSVLFTYGAAVRLRRHRRVSKADDSWTKEQLLSHRKREFEEQQLARNTHTHTDTHSRTTRLISLEQTYIALKLKYEDRTSVLLILPRSITPNLNA